MKKKLYFLSIFFPIYFLVQKDIIIEFLKAGHSTNKFSKTLENATLAHFINIDRKKKMPTSARILSPATVVC